MKSQLKKLEKNFEKANKLFLKKNNMLLIQKVSERTLCGALMLELHDVLSRTEFSHYYVDVEYNRNNGGKIKTIKETSDGIDEKIVTINCDLIVHSRGMNQDKDNLIALEMKKSTGTKKDKDNDRTRLECLTKTPEQEVYSFGGKVFPKYVCGYDLGIYYEINFKRQVILMEYYKKGIKYKEATINYEGNNIY